MNNILISCVLKDIDPIFNMFIRERNFMFSGECWPRIQVFEKYSMDLQELLVPNLSASSKQQSANVLKIPQQISHEIIQVFLKSVR